MDEFSRSKKWLSGIAMLIAMVATISWSFDDLLKSIGQHHWAPLSPEALADATVSAVMGGFLAWLIACAICGLIPPRLKLWRAGTFLLIIIGTTFAVNLAVLSTLPSGPNPREVAAFENVIEDIKSKVIADREAYLTELYALGYPEFLHPASLGAPNGLERAQEKIKKARAIVRKYRTRNDARLAEFHTGIEKLNIQDETKKQVLAGYGAGLKKISTDRLKYWDLQDGMMAEYEAMLDDLSESRDNWKTDGDKILFYRQHDLDLFNSHMQTAAKLEKEVKALADKFAAEHKRIEAKYPAN
jgi:hypothetical protein